MLANSWTRVLGSMTCWTLGREGVALTVDSSDHYQLGADPQVQTDDILGYETAASTNSYSVFHVSVVISVYQYESVMKMWFHIR